MSVTIKTPEEQDRMREAGRLAAQVLDMITPYVEPGVPTAPSNVDFDASLRARNPRWGLRDLDAVKAAAVEAGFAFTERRAMPANNLMLLFHRA